MEAEERPAKIRRISPVATLIDEPPFGPQTIGSTLDQNIDGGVAHPNGLDEDRSNVTTHCQVSRSELHTSDLGLQHDRQAQTSSNVPVLAGVEQPGNLNGAPQLSKSQLKKLKRKQEWEAGRESRKVKRKEKMQEKKQRKREKQDNINSIVETPGLDGDGKPEKTSESAKKPRFRSTQLPITFILDCAFDDLMLDKERMSLAAQVTRCYSDNCKSPYKAHLAVSSFGGHLKERFDNVLEGHHNSWKGVRFFSEDFVEVAARSKEWMQGPQGGTLAGAFAQLEADTPPPLLDVPCMPTMSHQAGETVYLTSDSPHTLTSLKPYSTYVIGGLVDRNRHKGICYKRAMAHGMETARLPIGEYMEMTSRFVLATNHVHEIMLRWLELGDWGEAFVRVMPKRKGGVLKGKGRKGGGRDGAKEVEGAEGYQDGGRSEEEQSDDGSGTEVGEKAS